jgi:AraC family transcriptional regulator
MSMDHWKSTPQNSHTFERLSILYGTPRGGFLDEHSHEDVQVSVHLERHTPFRVEPLHIHVYPSHLSHAGGWRTGTEVMVFHLAPSLLAEIRQELTLGIEVELVPARASRDPVAEGLGLLARDECQSHDPTSSLSLEWTGLMMARHLLRRHASFPVSGVKRYSLSDRELEQLRGFVLDHLHRGFSVRELAASIGVGPAVLGAKLQGSVGQSPWRFVQGHRIRHAQQVLRGSQTPLAEVAAQLGYADQSHFTHSFRRATGLTPKAYRSEFQS